jgi:hypothetical protein
VPISTTPMSCWQTPDFSQPLESRLLIRTPTGVGALSAIGPGVELQAGTVSELALGVPTDTGVLVRQTEANPFVGRGLAAPHTLLLSSDGLTDRSRQRASSVSDHP